MMDIKNFETAYLNAGGKASELEKEDGEYASSKAQMGWQMWQEAKAQAVPERLSINLSGHDIQTIANFMCYEDPENLDTEVTIQDCKEGFDGAGIYAWVSEYPEEGGIKLGEAQEQSHD